MQRTASPKFNPLADWSDERCGHYIERHDVPYNALHDAAIPSIGCEPCTRAIAPGEDVRAGRWWWEQADAQGMRAARTATADCRAKPHPLSQP